MKPVIFSIFLFSYLLSIAAALKCYHCFEKESDTCQEEEIECPEGDRCITVSEDYSYHGKYHSIFKGCSGYKICDKETYARATSEKYFKVSTQCCDEDLCNSKMYEMPEDGEPSGPLCPGCFWLNTTEECEATRELQCLKKEDQCVHFAGDVEKPDNTVATFSLKGCMSPQECKTDASQLIAVKIVYNNMFKCNPPKPLSEDQKDEEKY